jgi:hypothetical protein
MNWSHDPKSWLDFPAECVWYLMPGVVFHAIGFIVSLVVIMVLDWFRYHQLRLSALMIFQAYLIIFAMIANGIWSCIVWGNLYWSVDYTSDFSVFMPIRRSRVEYSWGTEMAGGLNGITLTQLNLVWALFAVSAWIIAFFATRWTCTRQRKPKRENKPAHPTAGNAPV